MFFVYTNSLGSQQTVKQIFLKLVWEITEDYNDPWKMRFDQTLVDKLTWETIPGIRVLITPICNYRNMFVIILREDDQLHIWIQYLLLIQKKWWKVFNNCNLNLI